MFFFLLLRPAYIVFLRHQLQARMPEQWAQMDTNGSFRLLVPKLYAARYHDEARYAARIQQVLVHGFPYNPYWREDRGIKGSLHDSIGIYLLSAVALLCGGNLTLTWVVAVALIGALWFLLFYAVFRTWSGRPDVAVPLARFSVLFADL